MNISIWGKLVEAFNLMYELDLNGDSFNALSLVEIINLYNELLCDNKKKDHWLLEILKEEIIVNNIEYFYDSTNFSNIKNLNKFKDYNQVDRFKYLKYYISNKEDYLTEMFFKSFFSEFFSSEDFIKFSLTTLIGFEIIYGIMVILRNKKIGKGTKTTNIKKIFNSKLKENYDTFNKVKIQLSNDSKTEFFKKHIIYNLPLGMSKSNLKSIEYFYIYSYDSSIFENNYFQTKLVNNAKVIILLEVYWHDWKNNQK